MTFTVRLFSCQVMCWLFVTPWTVDHQAPLPMEFSRQEYLSGLPFPAPGDFPTRGSNLRVSHIAGRFFTIEPPRKPSCSIKYIQIITQLSPPFISRKFLIFCNGNSIPSYNINFPTSSTTSPPPSNHHSALWIWLLHVPHTSGIIHVLNCRPFCSLCQIFFIFKAA